MVVLKEDIVIQISHLLGASPPPMSTGSTEPREIFDLVNSTLGLELGGSLTKPQMAQAIVEAAGHPWNADYESAGGTVTKKGLQAVLEAVEFFVG